MIVRKIRKNIARAALAGLLWATAGVAPAGALAPNADSSAGAVGEAASSAATGPPKAYSGSAAAPKARSGSGAAPAAPAAAPAIAASAAAAAAPAASVAAPAPAAPASAQEVIDPPCEYVGCRAFAYLQYANCRAEADGWFQRQICNLALRLDLAVCEIMGRD